MLLTVPSGSSLQQFFTPDSKLLIKSLFTAPDICHTDFKTLLTLSLLSVHSSYKIFSTAFCQLACFLFLFLNTIHLENGGYLFLFYYKPLSVQFSRFSRIRLFANL